MKKIGKIAEKASLNVQRAITVVLALVIGGLIVGEIIFRYFLNLPLMWVEELTLFLLGWLYFAGAIYVTGEGTHIKGGVLQLCFKNKPRVLDHVQVGISSICFGVSCLMVVWGYHLLVWNLGIDPRTVHLRLPSTYSQLSIFVGFILMSMYFLRELINSVHRLL